MDRYNRAWRDPRSPLTPLTPLTTRVFTFDNTPSPTRPNLRRSQNEIKFRRPKLNHLTVPHQTVETTRGSTGDWGPKHFSQDFMRIRSVFSPSAQSTASQTGTTTPRSQSSQQTGGTVAEAHSKRQFKRSSPVDQPTLSPRVSSLLSRTGNEHLTELFTRQEIDLQILIQMTLEDLESLGVRGVKELKLAIDVIKFAKKFF
ncbi:uncharacterized protein gnu [Drosophila montana]|uniref:uncharacterized protein gnu n=1 Tax=Drosophila montana TaxID=40370 RepID=UPI00313CEEFB